MPNQAQVPRCGVSDSVQSSSFSTIEVLDYWGPFAQSSNSIIEGLDYFKNPFENQYTRLLSYSIIKDPLLLDYWETRLLRTLWFSHSIIKDPFLFRFSIIKQYISRLLSYSIIKNPLASWFIFMTIHNANLIIAKYARQWVSWSPAPIRLSSQAIQSSTFRIHVFLRLFFSSSFRAASLHFRLVSLFLFSSSSSWQKLSLVLFVFTLFTMVNVSSSYLFTVSFSSFRFLPFVFVFSLFFNTVFVLSLF